MSEQSTVALLGGPSSGKTTYLGAIVDALQSDQLPGLSLRGIAADATAYERLVEPLLEGTYPQRTKAERHVLELPLRAQGDASTDDFTLTAGDYDGEEVERLFQERTRGFSPEWQARAHARGLLLFVRPEALAPLPRLRLAGAPDEAAHWQAVGEKSPPKEEPRRRTKAAKTDLPRPEQGFGPGLNMEALRPPPVAPTDPVRVPTALAIVELLQFLRHVRGLDPGERPRPGELRIAFLATGWDAVDSAWRAKGPARFLVEHAPLLEDFLWSNFHPEDVFRFGLSSTGGDLRDLRYQERYRSDPHGFVEWADVKGTVHKTRDLSLPISWVLFGDRALPTDSRAA